MSKEDRSDEYSEAWGDVDGAVLLDELRDTLTRFVAFPSEHAANAVTLWIAVTHALPAFECAPRLVFRSPQKRCGKTRALDIVQALSHDPLATADATVAAIFRSIGDGHPPTLFIDEADAIWGSKKLAEQHEDLRKLLNAGHQRGRPALRCVGPSQIPTKFATFAMVALAGIGDCIPDTITDRAVNIMLRRRSSAEKVAAFRSRRDASQLEGLGKRLAAWAIEQIQQLQDAEPSMPVEDRAADTWEPLVAVADAAGGHWPTTARAACMALVGEADSADEDRSYSVRLLADIKSIFEQHGSSFLPSQQLVNALRAIDESPWTDFELTRSKLAYRLREFGIKTAHNTTGSARGLSAPRTTVARRCCAAGSFAGSPCRRGFVSTSTASTVKSARRAHDMNPPAKNNNWQRMRGSAPRWPPAFSVGRGARSSGELPTSTVATSAAGGFSAKPPLSNMREGRTFVSDLQSAVEEYLASLDDEDWAALVVRVRSPKATEPRPLTAAAVP